MGDPRERHVRHFPCATIDDVVYINSPPTTTPCPGGRSGNARPSDSRRENGDRPTLGVSGWGNWSAPIPTVMIPLGFPEGKRRSPTTSGVSMHIMGHRPHHFPAPNVNDVVPYSPGLRRSRRYPGSWPHRVPYPARGCAVRARRGVGYQRAEWDGVRWWG